MKTLVFCCLIASPSLVSGDAVAEWRDLQRRCADAVTAGAMLDVDGLEIRDPTLIADVVDQPPFGVRIEYDALRTSARTVPTGIWGQPGGRFEMQIVEFTTRPGVRTICEVAVARGASPLSAGEALRIVGAFRDIHAAELAGGDSAHASSGTGDDVRIAKTLAAPNPRGCPVVVSLTSDPARGYFRTSVAERAGVPACGGPSLATGGLMRSPAGLNPKAAP